LDVNPPDRLGGVPWLDPASGVSFVDCHPLDSAGIVFITNPEVFNPRIASCGSPANSLATAVVLKTARAVMVTGGIPSAPGEDATLRQPNYGQGSR
jgi:hypothetical protein